jgi:hypothetical protein
VGSTALPAPLTLLLQPRETVLAEHHASKECDDGDLSWPLFDCRKRDHDGDHRGHHQKMARA